MSYSRETIVEEYCKAAINEPKSFYAQKFINLKDEVSGEKTDATEVIAEFLMEDDNLAKITHISEDSRHKNKKSYKLESHDGHYPKKANHNNEKIIEIDIFNQEGTFNHIGKILDYQTPLKTKRDDKYGEIDLLAVNDDDKKVYILELKRKNSNESLLRCVLEAYTYYKIVGKKDLLEDFDRPGYDIKIAPFVFKSEESRPYKEWLEMKNGKRPKLMTLIKHLDVEVVPYFITKENDVFVVSDK